jgi:hypothetical protein
MNTMNIPGFTAEASLLRKSERYRRAAGNLSTTDNRRHGVSPQQGFSGLGDPRFRRIPDCGPDGILICFPWGCFCA